MSVYRPNGCRIYQIDFWRLGKRYCRTSGTTKFVEAKRIERRWKLEARELQRPPLLRPSRGRTFHAVWTDYYKLVGRNSARADALHGWLLLADSIVGSDTPIETIDDHMMLEFRERYRHLPSDRTRTADRHENSSVNDFTKLILRMINYAREYLHEALTPPESSKFLLPEIWRERELRVDEEKRLERTTDPEFARVWKFIIETGLRREPACGLRWDQVDKKLRKITVIEKGKRPHTVPLSDVALGILNEVEGEHPALVFVRVANRDCKTKHACYRKGDRVEITPGYFWKAVKRALRHAEISNFTVHDFRHTAATRLLRACGNIAVVQRFLGHVTVRQTMRYVHMVEQDVAAAVAMRDIARLQQNAATVAELKGIPEKRPGAVGWHQLFLALDLRRQLEAHLAEIYGRAA